MEQLVKHLIARGVLRTPRLIAAFREIDRRDFVRAEDISGAYEDYPLSIGAGQTISQPYTVAFMLELLAPRPGEKILDVGAGSGWTTALLAEIAGDRGRVIGREIVPELAEFGQDNLKKYRLPQAEIGLAAAGGPGEPAEAPFDKILVSAAAEELPQKLLDQLKIGGIMVLPVQNAIWRVKRTAGQPRIDRYEGFAFVPLK